MSNIGLWHVLKDGPARLEQTVVAAEKLLEDWIESDPGLLEHGLRIVGRQLRLEGGPLDLLALDARGRWVLIEIKRERLRRDVVAQAIDYASCLHRLDPEWLRKSCDDYLHSKGKEETLDSLLEGFGRSLESEADGRDIVIYLVGTGYDPGLERMVSFLAERAELSVRIVVFSAFQDQTGGLLLAREIHESLDETTRSGSSAPRPTPTPDAIFALAGRNGVGEVVRTLYQTAMELGLHARMWATSIMFAPPANRTRCLFVVWVHKQRVPGEAKVYVAAEAFEQFYGIREAELVAAVGSTGYVMLDQAGASRVAAGFRQLLRSNEL